MLRKADAPERFLEVNQVAQLRLRKKAEAGREGELRPAEPMCPMQQAQARSQADAEAVQAQCPRREYKDNDVVCTVLSPGNSQAWGTVLWTHISLPLVLE